MNRSVSNNMKKRILLLDKEIKKLEQDRQKLLDYYAYFKNQKDEYSLLTNIPSNPDENNPQILHDYSILNVDIIGRIICELVKKYDNKDYFLKRLTMINRVETYLETYLVDEPILVIGPKNKLELLHNDCHNIVIPYKNYMSLDKYPTKKPVSWPIRYGGNYEVSNYNYLLNTWDGLNFEYPSDQEYIKELIYSLAYYQEQHNIKYMTDEETIKVYKRIYKK